ncbi:MAG: hypothetical protein M1457_12100, partial [bacterium]|nr:hypothetical protein [bacterium]
PSLDSQGMGAVLNWKKGPFPMDLSYNEYRLRETGFESQTETTNRILEYRVRNQVGEWMQTELRYRLQDLKQDFRADSPLVDTHRRTHLRSNELELSNTIFLSADRRSSLLSFLRYYEESGSQDLKNYYWQERLLLRHTPNFSTYYLASLLRNKFESSTVDTKPRQPGHGGRAQLEKRSLPDGPFLQRIPPA